MIITIVKLMLVSRKCSKTKQINTESEFLKNVIISPNMINDNEIEILHVDIWYFWLTKLEYKNTLTKVFPRYIISDSNEANEDRLCPIILIQRL